MFGAEWGYGEGLARRADVVNLSNGRNFRVRSIPTKSSARSKVGFEGQSGSDSSLPTPPVLTPKENSSQTAASHSCIVTALSMITMCTCGSGRVLSESNPGLRS